MTGSAVRSKLLVTGGMGRLAQAIAALDPSVLAPGRSALDVTSPESIAAYCSVHRPGVIVHAAAVTNKYAEDKDEEYIRTNIIGTSHVALWCLENSVRLVYISSDYVYPGESGAFTEESPLFPVNQYAASKLGGECAVRMLKNSLIIRISFYGELAFPRGCTDQYTSRMPVKEAADAVYRLALRDDVRGVINVGRAERRSLFDIIKKEFNPDVAPVTRKDLDVPYHIPYDSSLATTRFVNLMSSPTDSSRTLTACRVCGSTSLFRYIDLGVTPLANSYIRDEDRDAPEFREELAIQMCPTCGLSQLTKVVHPDLMFKNYLYVSSTTETFRTHCEEMAATTARVAGVPRGSLVMDIASNDGCLLSKYQAIGMRVIGVDPAENLAAEANAAGVPTVNAYWSTAIAKDIVARYGRPSVITATNVFAHVDDLHGFVEGVAACLAPHGIFVIECPYALEFIQKNEFDTAYHEHLSYIGITPLVRLMEMHGLAVFDVEYFPDLHGGTIRTYVSRKGEFERASQVAEYLAREAAFGITREEPYRAFARRVLLNKVQLLDLLRKEKAKGKVIWAYGASAKGNTLVNFFEITEELVPVAIDDNPKKWGYRTPGAHMRVVGIDALKEHRVDYLLLLAWNFQKEIIRRCEAAHYAGAFILPVPVPAIIPSTSTGVR
jgi:dTDP-4-dehydrorhamnose reductase/SAM-dependent methyltransferase